jgi:hypothetical protein
MTVRTIATRLQGDVENDKTVLPVHVERGAHLIVMEPEPAHTGMSAPAMRREGIAVVDYLAFNHGEQDVDKDVQMQKTRGLQRKTSFTGKASCKSLER